MIDWLIKWNPRKTEVATLAALLQANAATCWQQPRAGKRVTVWDEQVHIEGFGQPMRRVMRLTERTIVRLAAVPPACSHGRPVRVRVRCRPWGATSTAFHSRPTWKRNVLRRVPFPIAP